MDSEDFIKSAYAFVLWILVKLKGFFVWLWQLKLLHKLYLFLIIIAIFDDLRRNVFLWSIKILSFLL